MLLHYLLALVGPQLALSFVQSYDTLIGAASEGELRVVETLHEASVDEDIYIV